MADTDPTPGAWFDRNWKRIVTALALLGWLVAAVQAWRTGAPIPPPPPFDKTQAARPADPASDDVWTNTKAGQLVKLQPGGQFVATPDGFAASYGWVADPDVLAANANPAITPQFRDTPAGKAALGDEDVFLWQAVRKVNNRGPPWYPNVNQESVGCCVGTGNKHGADICQAVQILDGRAEEWKPIAVESIYGPSRVEIGGGRIRGDGSVGAWAKQAMEKIGVLPMEAFPGHDLTTFSPARCREWGRTGMPDALEPTARMHPVKGAALVRSWADVKRAIDQGYPVAVCSDQGFTMVRDRDGFARASGSWPHCMCICGVRKSPREGGFILNSWGDRAHTGGVWPEDMPVAGFWADAQTIDRMVRQGDSFALSDLAGFPARKVPLDWFIKAEPRRNPLDRIVFVPTEKPGMWEAHNLSDFSIAP
jgi:hypothetical protein